MHRVWHSLTFPVRKPFLAFSLKSSSCHRTHKYFIISAGRPCEICRQIFYQALRTQDSFIFIFQLHVWQRDKSHATFRFTSLHFLTLKIEKIHLVSWYTFGMRLHAECMGSGRKTCCQANSQLFTRTSWSSSTAVTNHALQLNRRSSRMQRLP